MTRPRKAKYKYQYRVPRCAQDDSRVVVLQLNNDVNHPINVILMHPKDLAVLTFKKRCTNIG
jgi:hypothetical protein